MALPPIYTFNKNDVQDKLQSILKIRLYNKQKYGEVFTPEDIINTMLKTLPNNVWYNPNLKWLDPCCGIGNFFIVVYMKLMETLEKQFPNREKRHSHIIENMLYQVEYNKNNYNVAKHIFGNKANLVYGDFLKMKIGNLFNITHFNIILGNPPYNSLGTKHYGIKNLYVDFSVKSFDIMQPNGYLLFIHPSAYRINNHKIQGPNVDLNDIYTNKQIMEIHMYSQAQTAKIMDIMMNIDIILVRNTENSKSHKTKIVDIHEKQSMIHIEPNTLIPNYGFTILDKMKQKTSQVGSQIHIKLTSEKHAQNHNVKKSKYPNIHTIVSKGKRICFSAEPHSMMRVPKMIINGIGSHNYVYDDKEGKYGVTQIPAVVLNPSKNTKMLIQSSLFHYLVNATKIIGNNISLKLQDYLPEIRDKIPSITDLYRYFEFSNSEIKDIEKVDIPEYVNRDIESCYNENKMMNKTAYKNKKQKIFANKTRKVVKVNDLLY